MTRFIAGFLWLGVALMAGILLLRSRRSAKAVGASEVRYRRLFESAKDGILILDAETGMIVDVNPFLIELLGFPREAFLGERLWELGFFKDIIANRANFLELQQKGYVRYDNLPLKTADGRPIAVEFVSNVYPVGNQKVIQCNIRDITERKRAEAALRESEDLLSESQSIAHVGSWVLDLATGTIVWTPETYRVFGIPPDTSVLSTGMLLNLIHPDDRAAMETWIGACLAGEEPPDLEFRANPPDGSVRYVLGRGHLVRNAENKPIRMTGIAQDITERKRAEETLRQSEERHRTILETATDGFWLADAQGRLLQVNKAYCRMSGYSAEELVAMRVPDLEANETASDTAAHIQEMIAQGGDRFESRHRRKDGSVFDVEVTIQYKPVENGQFVVFLHDITERKRAEAERNSLQLQLAQAQKMESIGRLAGGVAHDFNNLLNVIMGYSGLALRGLKRDDPATKSLAEVQKAAEKAAELTRQLLAFSRKQALHPRVLDLNSVIGESEKMLRRLIREDVSLVVVPGSGLGLVKADPSQINQILMNLAVNSRDAMPQGGKLIIETANAELDEAFVRLNREAQQGSYVMLAVRDTGVGMDQETLGRLFEPFFTTKEVGKGTGLGLSMVYGIVKQSDGFITVNTEPGQGAEFRIYLPRVFETPEPVLAGEAEWLLRGAETILLAEDEPAMRELVREFLESAGYQVLVARDVKEAIQLAMQHKGPLDLLLTDVVMPDLSGPQLAEHLQPFRPQMKVLYMSGYADALVAGSTKGSEVDLINKPFTEENLLRRLREVLGG